MVAQILRLKLTLLSNAFRRNPWLLAGTVIALFYAIATSTAAAVILLSLRFLDVEIARGSIVVFGIVVFCAFLVLPLLLGLEDPLDVRSFSLLGLSNNWLATSLALASLVSIPAVLITIVAIAQIVTWSRGLLPTFIALISAVLIVVTSVLMARLSTAVASLVLSTRRAKDIAGIVGVVLLAALSPLLVQLTAIDWGKDGFRAMSDFAATAGWSPLGAAWAAPGDAVVGDPAGAWLKVLIAIGWVGALWLAWRIVLGVILLTPERYATARRYRGLGWFDRLPHTPTWAIAARGLTYWTRDSRYLTSLIAIPLIPLIMVVALAIGGVQPHNLALLPLPVMCLFLSWSIHNDIAFDNTAIWLHLSASTSGLADRWGRVIPVLIVGLPLIAAGSIISVAIFGDWSVLPSLVGVSAGILLCGLGISSFMSARFPYPSVRPGDSPFAQPQGGNTAGIIQAFSFFGILILTAPAVVCAVLGFLEGGLWPVASLVAGVCVGLPVLLGGISWGAAVFDKRGPELLALSLRN